MINYRKFHLISKSSQIELATSPQPESLGPRQILIEVAAASLNYRDLLVLQDTSENRRNGLVPLSDAAGTVINIGSEVTSWKVGDRVSPNFFADWKNGRFTNSVFASALGGNDVDGVLSKYIVADESSVVEVPEHLSLLEAATLPCAAVTAWQALFERGDLQAGQTVLVQGTGGVAMFGLQLAVAHGAKVIVTSSSDDKLEQAKAYGAWQTINYKSNPEWDVAALDFTDGKGIDHILELGGPDTYTRSISAIAFNGSIAQIGVLSGFSSSPVVQPLQFKNADIHGICVGSVEHYRNLNRFMLKHKITPIIDRTFDFDDSIAAYDYLKSAKHLGKIVIEM